MDGEGEPELAGVLPGRELGGEDDERDHPEHWADVGERGSLLDRVHSGRKGFGTGCADTQRGEGAQADAEQQCDREADVGGAHRGELGPLGEHSCP